MPRRKAESREAGRSTKAHLTLVCAVFLCAAATLIFTLTGHTQSGPGIKTDRQVYTEPSLPTLPAAGGKFTDPTFGTEIMRVTDAGDGAAPGLGTYYSHWPTFNCNSTRLLIRKGETGEAIVKTFDPTNFTLSSGRITLPQSDPNTGDSLSWEGATWSNSNPDVIYVHTGWYVSGGGMRLYSYNVPNNAFTLVRDFSSLAGSPNDYLAQMYMSGDDDVFCWLRKRGGSGVTGYLVYKKSTNTVLYDAPDNYVGGIDEVHVDKSGKWLHIVIPEIQPDGTSTRFLNLQTGAMQPLVRAVDHPPGHGDMGTEIMIGFDNYNNGLSYRNLSDVHAWTDRFYFRTGSGPSGGTSDWTQDFHGTMLADNEDWITIGTYDDPAITLPDSGVFENEIIQVALDGSEQIRRICHTRSTFDNQSDTTGYWGNPKPTISKDGRYIAFTSNWENSGRYDLFIVKIPPAPSLHSSSTPVNVTWTNLVNSTASGNNLTSTADDARGETTQAIASGNGSIINTVSFTDSSAGLKRFGLINGAFTGDPTEIDYLWKYWDNGVAYPCINNTPVTNYVQTANGDTLEVRINGTSLEWYHNSTLVYTATAQSLAYPYRGVGQLTVGGYTLSNVRMTGVNASFWTNLINASATGNDLTATADNARAETMQAIVSGNGSIVVTPVLNNSSPGIVRVGLINGTFTGDPTEIDYHWKYWDDGVAAPCINNVPLTSVIQISNGETLGVRINGTSVEYYRNSTLFYTATGQTLSYPYRGVAQITQSGDRITNVGLTGAQ